MNSNAALYALATVLLGAVGIWFHEFALQWQAVPAGIPMHTPLAYLSGALLVAGGGGGTATFGATVLVSTPV